ncbi:MAG: hypothetical protein HY763_04200 [Planctomycetes bacterium]|nr:hypothetical protein [Planctomycetota bacterium]
MLRYDPEKQAEATTLGTAGRGAPRQTKLVRPLRTTLPVWVVAWAAPAALALTTQTLRPVADGTIADGGSFGTMDGSPDHWDWTFNQSSYEGAITLRRGAPPLALEHRLVWEFDLATVAAGSPVTATLTFTIRGAPRFPADDANVHVYAYPADLLERAEDFAAGPGTLVGSRMIAPYQPATAYTLNVSAAVSAAVAGSRKVGFRFQIDPASTHEVDQAFVDALDSDPTSKPFLTVTGNMPGDANGDGDVDLGDYIVFQSCFAHPGAGYVPACAVFDADGDTNVDLSDFLEFQNRFTGRK